MNGYGGMAHLTAESAGAQILGILGCLLFFVAVVALVVGIGIGIVLAGAW